MNDDPVYTYRCGCAGTAPVTNGNRFKACPEHGERVESIATRCRVCRCWITSPGGYVPAQKCARHRCMSTITEVSERLEVSVPAVRSVCRSYGIQARKVYSRTCYTAGQIKNIRTRLDEPLDIDEQGERPPCDNWDCIHRTACFRADRTYRTECPEYEPETFEMYWNERF